MAIAEECNRVNPLVVFLVSMVLLVPLDFSLSMFTLGCLSSTMQYIAMGCNHFLKKYSHLLAPQISA